MNADQASAKVDEVGRAGREARDSDVLEHAVRVGLLAYGTVHLLIAWLGAQLAFGDRSGSASGTGALSELAQKPFGQLMLWVVGLGFFALVIWQALEALFGYRDLEGLHRLARRLGSTGRVVVYAALGVSALKIALGSGSSQNTDTLTARLMAMPLGTLLVGLVGLLIVSIGVGHGYIAFSEGFRDHLDVGGDTGRSGKLYVGLAKIGYVSKGIAFVVVGGLFGYAALTHDPKKSGGLDQALQTILEQPFGAPLLVLVALGLACFGLFCFAWARHVNR